MEVLKNLKTKKDYIGISCDQERKYQGGQLIIRFNSKTFIKRCGFYLMRGAGLFKRCSFLSSKFALEGCNET